MMKVIDWEKVFEDDNTNMKEEVERLEERRIAAAERMRALRMNK